ncbi:MAG: glutamate racemase [Chthonomonadaceae bacterium]|nr:glutamate racemase [Chthonomonadaceae bacterium]
MRPDVRVDSNAPIGVFDSGLGGLTVVSQMLRLMPRERILFLADQAHVPYGGRDLSEVRGFACGISEGLLNAGCKAVVMACNISSATALETVRSHHPGTLVLGVIEPGARAAAKTTQNGRVGVLTTVGTAKSAAYTRTLHALDPELFVLEVSCPEFVPLVEGDAITTPEAYRAAKTYMQPLLDAGTDTVVLGCTHYPFLLPVLHEVAPRVCFVNPAEQTVIELAREIESRNIATSLSDPGPVCLTTTGDPGHFATTLHRFLSHPDDLMQVVGAEWIGGDLALRHRNDRIRIPR